MKNKGFTLVEVLIVVLIVGIIAAVTVPILLGRNSDGMRSGMLVKISRKGIFSKTWEGELMLGSGNSGQSWEFSLKKDSPTEKALAEDLQNKISQPITISYHEAFFVWPWEADTNYLVESIK